MKSYSIRIFFTIIFFTGISSNINAQNNLTKNIASLQVNRQRLADVLEILSNKGHFNFSYNSSILKKDSLVTLTVYNKSVKEILDFLFKPNYEYLESGNYIIIRRAPIQFTLITSQANTEDKFYSVSGYVLDDQTGEKLSDVSVYEKEQLVSSLTNENGFFKIKLKARYKSAALTVSKELYEDTTVNINPNYNQQLTITVSPEEYLALDSIIVEKGKHSSFMRFVYRKINSIKVEKTKAGKFLLSAGQNAQSMNLSKFFTTRPYQVSFVPTLSTNGRLNAQVVNKISLNVLGGYSAGVNGAEFGGLFNINKKNMNGFQAAGIFNLVGGYVHGVQLAGIHNTLLDSMHGLQAAGISNFTKGKINGWQLAGIHNHASDTLKGVQIAGISNYANKKIEGLQIAGIGNFSRRQMSGTQIAGIFNYAKKMHGVQIGLINISDTSDGYSIGLLNLVNHGYHKISLYANEVMNTNVILKTGNSKLYSMLIGGMNFNDAEKIYSFGFGFGHDFILSKAFSISTEISSQYLYTGSLNYTNLLNKFSPSLNLHLNKYISFFGGPAFNVYYSNQAINIAGYKKNIPSVNYHTFSFRNNVNGWIGWNAGITIF